MWCDNVQVRPYKTGYHYNFEASGWNGKTSYETELRRSAQTASEIGYIDVSDADEPLNIHP